MVKRQGKCEGICPRCSGTWGSGGRGGKHLIGTTVHGYSKVEESWYCTCCGDRHELRLPSDDSLEALLLTPEQQTIFRAGRVRGIKEALTAIEALDRSPTTGKAT